MKDNLDRENWEKEIRINGHNWIYQDKMIPFIKKLLEEKQITNKKECEQCKLVDELAPSLSYCPEHNYSNPSESQRQQPDDLDKEFLEWYIKPYPACWKGHKVVEKIRQREERLKEQIEKEQTAKYTFMSRKLVEVVEKELRERLKKDWNCHCENPKPNGTYEIGEHEGQYQRCKICDKRIWK